MLKGKIALITGSAKGIGKSIALELAAHGATVIVNASTSNAEALATQREILEAGGKADVYMADISDPAQVEAMAKYVADTYGGLDILVNNAGISPKRNGKAVPIWETDVSDWTRTVDINLSGAFYCLRYFAPQMMEKRWGRIINISSMAGRAPSPITGCHYGATKAGLIGLGRCAAMELSPYNILVNTIAPGRIKTGLQATVSPEINKMMDDMMPLKRSGSPEGIARLVRFLVSEENDYIHGAVIDVNGGFVMS